MMTTDKAARAHENKVVMTKLPREEFSQLKHVCDREGKTISKKIRELINQEINQEFGHLAEGTKKKFFIPSENKIVEMWEVEE